MNEEIAKFIGRAKELSENNGLASGIVGSTKRQSVMNDLFKVALVLREAKSDLEKDKSIEEIVGILHVAQAMNIIGFEDLIELMNLLENINGKE